MVRYDSWYRKEVDASPASRAALAWKWALDHPGATCYALPWLFVVAPMLLMPMSLFEAAGADHLTSAMSRIVPMIDRMTATSVLPHWTKLTLTLLWATGPIWTIATAVICSISYRRGRDGVPEASFRPIAAGFILFSALILVLATVSPRPWKRVDSVQALLSSPFGLALVGWFVIEAGFIVIGFLVASQLIRLREQGEHAL